MFFNFLNLFFLFFCDNYRSQLFLVTKIGHDMPIYILLEIDMFWIPNFQQNIRQITYNIRIELSELTFSFFIFSNAYVIFIYNQCCKILHTSYYMKTCSVTKQKNSINYNILFQHDFNLLISSKDFLFNKTFNFLEHFNMNGKFLLYDNLS